MAVLAHYGIDFFEEEITAFDAEWIYDLGKNTLSADPDYMFWGVLQPMSDAQLLSLPEAQRLRMSYLIHTRETLKIAVPGLDDKNTYVRRNGSVFKVVALGEWKTYSFNRYGLEKTESMNGR